jgi:hypothetical protein
MFLHSESITQAYRAHQKGQSHFWNILLAISFILIVLIRKCKATAEDLRSRLRVREQKK